METGQDHSQLRPGERVLQTHGACVVTHHDAALEQRFRGVLKLGCGKCGCGKRKEQAEHGGSKPAHNRMLAHKTTSSVVDTILIRQMGFFFNRMPPETYRSTAWTHQRTL